MIDKNVVELIVDLYENLNKITNPMVRESEENSFIVYAKNLTPEMTAKDRIAIYVDGYCKYRDVYDRFVGKEGVVMPEAARKQMARGEAQMYAIDCLMNPEEIQKAIKSIESIYSAPHPNLPYYMIERPQQFYYAEKLAQKEGPNRTQNQPGDGE